MNHLCININTIKENSDNDDECIWEWQPAWIIVSAKFIANIKNVATDGKFVDDIKL